MRRRRSRRTRSSRIPPIFRRLWILPVSAVIVAALAYGVAGLKSSKYTAQATVVVTSAAGPVGQGSSAAAALAATYAAALPQDRQLRGFVAGKAGGLGPHSISAVPTQGSVVRLRFTAGSEGRALAGARAIAAALSAATPHSSVVSAGTLKLVSSDAGAGRTPTGRYHADAVLVVPGNAGPTEGLNPDDADKLATTYAGIVPTDSRLLASVGKAVGASSSNVGSDLSVVNEQNTSLLDISFTSADPKTAAAGATATAQRLAGPNPVAAGIVPSSVEIVSLPAVPATVTKHTGTALAVGAALGLLLGLVLLVAWERSDPRIRDAKELSSQIGSPATPVARLTPNAAHALLERWASLTDRVPARVALLAAGSRVQDETAAVARTLRDAGGALVRYVDARSGIPAEDPESDAGTNGHTGVVLIHSAPPGGEAGGEAAALASDLAVIVVPEGIRAQEVRDLAEELANFGIVPVWTLLTPRGYAAGRRRSPVSDAVPA